MKNVILSSMTSTSSPTKRSFSLEAQMAFPVVARMREDGLRVKQEFAVPWGICDIVAVQFDTSQVQLRLSYGQTKAIGPPLRLNILSKIPDIQTGKSITIRRLQSESFPYLRVETLSTQLDFLARMKFVKSPKRGLFQKINGWSPLHRRIVAIELKLSRISDAIAQARCNRGFATESYVALPFDRAYRIANSRRAETFRQLGIGLLGVTWNSCYSLLGSSNFAESCDDILQAHCVERFWRTRDSCP
jgi:hypothetical protein